MSLESILTNYEASDQKLIKKAFDMASLAHEGQTRMSGEPYIDHPVEVAKILAELKLDAKTIAAALLHDVPENTDVKVTDIEKKFGKDVGFLVNGVTRLTKVRLRGSQEPGYIENLRKMFIAAARDLRVVLIKLADRLHNMRTLSSLPHIKQENIARETLAIFAPLANRLGIGEIKGELEDLAFPYVFPDEYEELKGKIDAAFKERAAYVERARNEIEKVLESANVKPLDIHGRAKHLYSLFNKMNRKGVTEVSEITDLVALRIIVPTVADCYSSLGAIHAAFKPLPGRIKDYIAMPKPNGYQSLHTTIFGPESEVLEIQIRTKEMHEFAERGIAAHWSYDETGKPKHKTETPGHKFAWIKQLQELNKAFAENPKEFLESLELDFFQNRIFCFTPKGDVIDLPEKATPIDFAFAVHGDLGYYCQGAKANGKMIKLSDSLNNGDVVEILTSKNPVKVPRDWLMVVKTSRARERVRRKLNL